MTSGAGQTFPPITRREKSGARTVKAIHGVREAAPDPQIGAGVWIGPQSYFDARDLIIEDHVGWGPGAKVLGSEHTGLPTIPLIQTDLQIAPVRIGSWADIGVNAIILPGITVGRGAIIGAGAVVTHGTYQNLQRSLVCRPESSAGAKRTKIREKCR